MHNQVCAHIAQKFTVFTVSGHISINIISVLLVIIISLNLLTVQGLSTKLKKYAFLDFRKSKSQILKNQKNPSFRPLNYVDNIHYHLNIIALHAQQISAQIVV